MLVFKIKEGERMKSRVIQCKKCGREIITKRYQTKFCNDECRNNWHNDERVRLIEKGRQAEEQV